MPTKFAGACGLLQFLLCLICASSTPYSAHPGRFLIMSTPRNGRVSYLKILPGGRHGEIRDLITSGLVHPQGLAVDQKRGKLLIADPDTDRIVSYQLRSHGETLTAADPTTLAANVEARWVAVDGIGNAFFSDEARNQILQISAAQAQAGDTSAQVVYDGASLTPLNGPGGVAADTFYTYWTNKHIGTEVGSVARGAQAPDASNTAASVSTLASNAERSYGVCLALNNVYYTQPENVIFGVKKSGGAVTTVSDRLTNPRGCAWDGDGTVYVADRGANGIYSFAGNMQTLGAAHVAKVADYQDAFGVAVFNGAPRPGLAAALAAGLMALSVWQVL